jgi:aquaporin Z
MNAYLVEFIGTMFFIFVIISTYNPLAIGAAIAIAIYYGSPISGAHFNPAVSIVMTLNGKLSKTHLLPYILAQITGGVCALELLKVI